MAAGFRRGLPSGVTRTGDFGEGRRPHLLDVPLSQSHRKLLFPEIFFQGFDLLDQHVPLRQQCPMVRGRASEANDKDYNQANRCGKPDQSHAYSKRSKLYLSRTS